VLILTNPLLLLLLLTSDVIRLPSLERGNEGGHGSAWGGVHLVMGAIIFWTIAIATTGSSKMGCMQQQQLQAAVKWIACSRQQRQARDDEFKFSNSARKHMKSHFTTSFRSRARSTAGGTLGRERKREREKERGREKCSSSSHVLQRESDTEWNSIKLGSSS
jgi:hypothetical protein